MVNRWRSIGPLSEGDPDRLRALSVGGSARSQGLDCPHP